MQEGAQCDQEAAGRASVAERDEIADKRRIEREKNDIGLSNKFCNIFLYFFAKSL